MKRPTPSLVRGTTLPEALVAVLILAVFFASVFELNAVCLRYIDATKESVAALQSVQDRSEVLRNLAFIDLTNTSAVQTLMATPPNAAPFAQKATETVRISAFPTPNGITQFTRLPNGSEMMIALATSAVVLGATLTSSISLQKSFNANDNYFATHMQQIRIVDYLSRDVKRGLIVTTSVDLQTVTITTPNYIIQAGDPEAIANPSLIGAPRTPTITYTPSGP